MQSFRVNQRVLVSACGRVAEHVFFPPRAGVVRRLLQRDGSAWVELEERGPAEAHPFPEGDSRERHVLTWPDCCRANRVTPRAIPNKKGA